jgi:hypothetical protein
MTLRTFDLNKQMTDTPQHIKELQLKLWRSGSPMGRRKQALESNHQLFQSGHLLK